MLKLENLTKIHDRNCFDCGEADLNNFLQKTAAQQSKKGITKTHVLIDDTCEEKILGFITLMTCEIETEKLSLEWQKKFPNRISGIRLARLAISKDIHKKGYGEKLLRFALEKTFEASKTIGLVGLFVDALTEEAQTYYLQFGFQSMPNQLDNMFLPIKTIESAMNTE